jgi:hypothetical protein
MKSAYMAGMLVCAVSCLAAASVATLHIQVIEGEGAVHAVGSRAARPLTVEITDENGRPVSGAAVSFQLPDAGPGGVFGNGLHTDLAITDSNGRATVRSLQVNQAPGPFQVRITVSKDQARAGTLARQFIGNTSTPAGQSTGFVKTKSSKKWIVVALLAAGVAGGLGAEASGRFARSRPPAAPPTVSVGAPTISVGAP